MPENKVKFGLKNVHIAPETDTDTYDTPFALPGAVNLTLEPNGEESSFYADDMIYYQSVANQGYTGELEVALINEKFETEILGLEKEDTTNIITESRNAKMKKFAMGFEIDGDVQERKFWMYGCTATRPSSEAGTKTETIEPQTDTLTFTAAGLDSGYVRIKTSSETPEETLKTWYDKVVMPKAAEAISMPKSSVKVADTKAV